MQSKIIFLGTGGDSIVVGKQIRGSGGIIFQTGESQLHIDPGPGALVKAKEYDVNIRKNIAVLASTSDLLNSNDINAVIDAMTFGGLDRTGVLAASASVVNGNKNTNPVLSRYHAACVEKVLVMQPGQGVGINDIDIQAAHTNSTDPDCVGFLIAAHGFRVGYTSNTGYCNEQITDLKGSDILILNVPLSHKQKEPHHLSSDDAVEMIKGIKPRLAVITYYGIKMLQADPINEARIIQKMSNVQTVAAQDGMVIDPVSYSVNVRRRALGLF